MFSGSLCLCGLLGPYRRLEARAVHPAEGSGGFRGRSPEGRAKLLGAERAHMIYLYMYISTSMSISIFIYIYIYVHILICLYVYTVR